MIKKSETKNKIIAIFSDEEKVSLFNSIPLTISNGDSDSMSGGGGGGGGGGGR